MPANKLHEAARHPEWRCGDFRALSARRVAAQLRERDEDGLRPLERAARHGNYRFAKEMARRLDHRVYEMLVEDALIEASRKRAILAPKSGAKMFRDLLYLARVARAENERTDAQQAPLRGVHNVEVRRASHAPLPNAAPPVRAPGASGFETPERFVSAASRFDVPELVHDRAASNDARGALLRTLLDDNRTSEIHLTSMPAVRRRKHEESVEQVFEQYGTNEEIAVFKAPRLAEERAVAGAVVGALVAAGYDVTC